MASISQGMSNVRRTAVARRNNSPEGVVGQQRSQLLASGGATRREGLDAIRTFDPEQFLGADALEAIIGQSTVTNFLPQLRGLQGRNARRGVRGPLAGALEGDLASSFHRNITAEAGRLGGARAGLALSRAGQIAEIGGTDRAQGISLLGTELELQLAREQMEKEEAANKRKGWGSLVGGIVGGAAGSFIPGIGTGVGAGIGSRIGGSF